MGNVIDPLRRAVIAAIESGQETRYSIAKQAGIDYPSFARWLDDDRDIRGSTIDKLAEFLGFELMPTGKRKSAARKKGKK